MANLDPPQHAATYPGVLAGAPYEYDVFISYRRVDAAIQGEGHQERRKYSL